jgi:uncharacterized protein (TIGR02466 family)
MDNIIHPFPCPIYQNVIEEHLWPEIQTKVFQYIRNNKDLFEPSWYLCPTLSTFHVKDEQVLNISLLNSQIYSHVEKYLEYWGDFEKQPTSLTLHNIWVNIAKKGSYQEEHHHNDFFLSGTIYFQVNPESGPFQFINPLSAQSVLFNSPEKFGYSYTIKPQNSMIIIFPSWMPHRVLANSSNEDRISVSFNIKSNFK